MKKLSTVVLVLLVGGIVLMLMTLAVGCKRATTALKVPLAPPVPVEVHPVAPVIPSPALVPLVVGVDGIVVVIPEPQPQHKVKPVVMPTPEPTFLVTCPVDTSKPCEKVKPQ